MLQHDMGELPQLSLTGLGRPKGELSNPKKRNEDKAKHMYQAHPTRLGGVLVSLLVRMSTLWGGA